MDVPGLSVKESSNRHIFSRPCAQRFPNVGTLGGTIPCGKLEREKVLGGV